MNTFNVLSVAAEIFPLVKTGGLADVVGALPAALACRNVAVQTLVPGYPAVMEGLTEAQAMHAFDDLMGGPAILLRGKVGELDLFVIDAPHLYARPGNPYADAEGQEWPDNALRFAALSWVAAELGWGLLRGYRPAVVHAHDWHAGLVAAYFRYSRRKAPPVVFAIHNLAYQGLFDAALLPALKLPARAMKLDGVEFWGKIGFLKAGIQLADRVITVSPGYAAEIATERGGLGLGGLLRARGKSLAGILNGVDVEVWDPRADPALAVRYSAATLDHRGLNRARLQQIYGLDPACTGPLFATVCRLTGQKGMDLVLEALPRLIAAGGQLIVVGAGDKDLENAVAAAARAYPGRVGSHMGYSEELAHLAYGGADAVIAASRFEPCGLTQLCAMRYGATPIVARTGGLADTVIDANPAALAQGVATGLQFAPEDVEALGDAIERAVELYQTPSVWRTLQRNAMAFDSSWAASAQAYETLYRQLAEPLAPRAGKVVTLATTSTPALAPPSRSFAAYEADRACGEDLVRALRGPALHADVA